MQSGKSTSVLLRLSMLLRLVLRVLRTGTSRFARHRNDTLTDNVFQAARSKQHVKKMVFTWNIGTFASLGV